MASLLQHRKPNSNEELDEAQILVDDIKALQPNAIETVILQVEIDRARNQVDQAVKLIREFAAPSTLAPQGLVTLADLAEKLGQMNLAEELYRRLATVPGIVSGKRPLAAFLGRCGRTNEALDICEPLWANPSEVQVVAITCIDILFGSDTHPHTPDPSQIKRVAGWFKRVLAQPSQQRPNPFLFVGLGNLYERDRGIIRRQRNCTSVPSTKANAKSKGSH